MFARLIRGGVAGAVAGAAGTTALNGVTYLDMAVRGRPASTTPEQAIEKAATDRGVSIPGEGDTRRNRVSGLGQLSGLATGVAIGAVAGMLRGLHIRIPWVPGTFVIGLGAMAATDISLVRMRITDPSEWSIADWAADVVPHLAYGAVTSAALRMITG